jgi:hypothetical protein
MLVDGIPPSISINSHKAESPAKKAYQVKRLTEHVVSCPEDNSAFDFQMKSLNRKAIETHLQDSPCLSLAMSSLSGEVCTSLTKLERQLSVNHLLN